MKILTLPVNKAAFDMLATSMSETRKNEEYRAMSKHWYEILFKKYWRTSNMELEHWITIPQMFPVIIKYGCNTFDAVKFTNGYGHKVPSVVREWKGLTIGKPNPLWVPKGFLDLDKDYFRIELGEIIN